MPYSSICSEKRNIGPLIALGGIAACEPPELLGRHRMLQPAICNQQERSLTMFHFTQCRRMLTAASLAWLTVCAAQVEARRLGEHPEREDADA